MMDVHPSQQSRISRSKNIEDYLNSEELRSDVEALKNGVLNISLKAEVIERYLRKRSPSLLVGMDRLMEQSSSQRSTMMYSPKISLYSPPRHPSSVSGMSGSSAASISSSHAGHVSHSLPLSSISGLRISPLVMIDMIDRELDESRISMDKLLRRFKAAKFLLETEQQNLTADIKLMRESKVTFENLIKQYTDKKSGRVFHDKFLRFIETELQNGERDLRKMKLKMKSFQIEYNRLLARQEQRLELRDRVHPVDLDKLLIENEELLKKLEHKTKLVVELKKTVGKKGQILISMKSKLNDILLTLGNIRHDIKQKEVKYKFTEEKEIKNVNELITAEIVNENIKTLNSAFKSPDAHNYLQVQVRLNDMKAEKDVWQRRCSYQKQSILMLEHQLKQLAPINYTKAKKYSSVSYRSAFSSRSTDSMMKRFSRPSQHPIPHCTPTTPTVRQW